MREGLGNGQKAWKALDEKYNACSNATRQELYDCMNGTKLQGAQDPDEFLYRMETARNRLHVLQEDHTSPIVQSTSPELAEILSRLRLLTNSNLQGGQLRHGGQQPLGGQPQSG